MKLRRGRLAVKVACLFAVSAAAGGLMLQRQAGHHAPVAAWDYTDPPNTHPLTSTGPILPLPRDIVHAKDGIAAFPNGMTVRLAAIGKDNARDPDHFWTLAGGLVEEDLSPVPTYEKDAPPPTDGRIRQVVLELKNPPAFPSIPYNAYVPDSARSGLTWQEKEFHGWDAQPGAYLGSQGGQIRLRLYIDDPTADHLLFGVPNGPWKTIGSGVNTVTAPPFLHRDLIKGPWGSVTITQIPTITASTKSILGGYPVVFATIQATPALEGDELRLRAFDASGMEVPTSCLRNVATISESSLAKIARFEVESRPYVYAEFEGVHYDPDPKQWADIAWGETQPELSAEVGQVPVKVLAIAHTRSGDREWNKEQYVVDKLYTVEGKLWRDAPDWMTQGGFPKREFPTPNSEARLLPPPMSVILNIGKEGEEKPQIKLRIIPSDSSKPGEGLHPEWNKWTQYWLKDPYGGLVGAPPRVFLPVAPTPEARFFQIEIEAAKGAFSKSMEVKPNVAEVRTDRSQTSDYTLEVGKTVHAHFWLPNGVPVDRELDPSSLAGRQTRVFARLKSGERKLLKVTSYRRTAADPELRPSYDFDRNPGIPLGLSNYIPLVEVDAFEIESRPIEKQTLVVSIPGR
ncbi:hypothetical protein [Fimbriimonas ginsengisoli]|uniref:hypothetical protein n=1 Tax=Fimbriimonas ginsengisoli TaxID=1005039 RepID=UPI0011856D04|nr:hypothetical protein [Fimbriimonas ginsengisoli]